MSKAPAPKGAEKLVVRVRDCEPGDDPLSIASKGVADYLLSDNRDVPDVLDFYGDLHQLMVGLPRADDPRSLRLHLPQRLIEGARYIAWAKPAPPGPSFGQVWLIGWEHRASWQKDQVVDHETGERYLPRERAKDFRMLLGGYPRCRICRKPGNGRSDKDGALCREHS